MKSKILTVLFCASVICLAGCKSLPTTEQQLQSLETKAKGITYIVTAESMIQHPEWKPHFEVASEELRILSTSTNIDLPMITAIVSKLPIKELKGQHAAIIITAGSIFLQDEVGQIKVNQPEGLRRVALGAHLGIELAFGL